jgi:hypothetical protein
VTARPRCRVSRQRASGISCASPKLRPAGNSLISQLRSGDKPPTLVHRLLAFLWTSRGHGPSSADRPGGRRHLDSGPSRFHAIGRAPGFSPRFGLQPPRIPQTPSPGPAGPEIRASRRSQQCLPVLSRTCRLRVLNR